MDWQNVTVKLSDLQPWEHNPRSMTKRQAQRLLKSWQDLGQFQTIAIGPHGEVYDGHQRLSALLAAHGAQFAIDARQSDRELSDDERRYLTTQANLPVGQWNWDALASWDAAQLQEWGFDQEALKAWNNDAANLATMLTAEQQGDADAEPQIDRAAELNEKWQVKTGDLWRIGEHRLLCGDSTRREDVERVMQGEMAKVMPTDPPYGSDYYAGKNKGDYDSGARSEKIEGDSDKDSAIDLMSRSFSIAPIESPCAVFVFHDARFADGVLNVAHDLGWKCRAHLVWIKPTAQISLVQQYHQKHEPAYYFTNGANVEWNSGGTETTVLEFGRESDGSHPTMKPTGLFQKLIRNHSSLSDVVYDPFVGSGTTLVACQNLQRKCRAIEISPNYCAVILERMATAFPGIEIERL